MEPFGLMANGSQSPQDTATPPQANGASSKPAPSTLDGATKTYVHRLKSSASSLILPSQLRAHRSQPRPSSGLGRTLSAAGTAAKAAAKATIRRSQGFLLGRKSVFMDSDGGPLLDAHATHREAGGSSPSSGNAKNPGFSKSAEVGQKRKHSEDNIDSTSQGAPKPKSRITDAPEGSRSKQPIEEKDDYILNWMSYGENAVDSAMRRTWSPDTDVSSLTPQSKKIYYQIQGGSDRHLPLSRQSSPPLHSQGQNQRGSASTGQFAFDPRRMQLIQEARGSRPDIPMHYPDQQNRSGVQPACDRRSDSYSSQTSMPSRSDPFIPTGSPPLWRSHGRRGSGATLTTNSGTVSDATSMARLSVSTSATTITNATSPDFLLAQAKRTRPDSRTNSLLGRPAVSPQSSIPNISRVHASASQETDDYSQKSLPPVPALPSNVNYLPINIIFDSTNSLPIICQVLKAGNQAQQRRQFFPGDIVIDPPVVSEIPASTDSLPCPASKERHDGLSIIDEHASDAESSKAGHLLRPDDEEMADRASSLDAGRDARNRDRSECRASETATLASRQATTPSCDTSVTSLGDSPEPEGSSPDGSDNDTASNCSDHTDVSLLDAFYSHPTPFGSDLLSVLFGIKEAVVACITQQVGSAVRQDAWGQGQNADPATSTSTSPPANDSGQSSLRNEAGSAKRPFRDDEEGHGPGRGDGDGDKRRRPNSPAEATVLSPVPSRKFACPFHKRYSKRDWLSKACYGPGFPTVHRVKEHIYRRHGVPRKCDRCHAVFENNNERLNHVRAPTECEVHEPPVEQEVTCLDQGKDEELRKREKKGLGEEERWKRVYRIVFPGQDVPSPYHGDGLESQRPDAITIAHFGQFMLEPLLQSIANALASHAHTIQINEGFRQIIRIAIESCFDNLLSQLSNRQGPPSQGSSPAAIFNTSSLNSEDQTPTQANRWVDSQGDTLQLSGNGHPNRFFDQLAEPSTMLTMPIPPEAEFLYNPLSIASTPSAWVANTHTPNLAGSPNLFSIGPSRPRSMGVYDSPIAFQDHNIGSSSLTRNNLSTEVPFSPAWEGLGSGATTAVFDYSLQNQIADLRAREADLVLARPPSAYLPPLSPLGGELTFDPSAFRYRPGMAQMPDKGAPDADVESRDSC